MRLSTTAGLIVFSSLVGCAHSPQPVMTQATQKNLLPPAKPQVEPAPVAAATVDPAAELDAALKGARLLFDFNSDLLTPASMDTLQRVAEVLRKHHAVALKIEGNCDERGTEEYNLLLGQRRAEAARKYLADLGVSSSQLDAVSYGALRPAAPGHTEDAWALNRRDELHASR